MGKELNTKTLGIIKEVPRGTSLDRLALRDKVIEQLSAVMNEIHQVNYSVRFWTIVMGQYANAAITMMHAFQKEALPSRPPLNAINSVVPPGLKKRLQVRIPLLVKHYRNFNALKTINSLLQSNDHFTIALPDLEVIREKGTTLPQYYPVYPGRGALLKRKRANAIAERYTDHFYANMIRMLPMVYVEYFEKEINKIVLSNPVKKIFHSHTLPPFPTALIIAKYIEHGAKLFCYQHGAYYGELVGHNAHVNESSVSDEFHTWGWKIRDNDVPDKAYRLEQFRLEYDRHPKENKFGFLMCYPYLYNANLEFYKAGTEYFQQHIDFGKYKKVLARPRPTNKIFSHAARLSFINDSNITIDNGLQHMAAITAQCGIVIQFTIPSTNFFECLYVDHPTIGLLRNDQPTSIVKPYYDFLQQQGVIHNDFESLVKHLNKTDVAEWWQSLISQPMYRQFKNEFLRQV